MRVFKLRTFSTRTSATSGYQYDEVYPDAFVTKASEQHPNLHLTIEQNRETIALTRNKEKMIKLNVTYYMLPRHPNP